MTLSKLIEVLKQHQKEIGCDGENIASHGLESTVSFSITNADIDLDLEIDDSEYPCGVELDLLPGCLCPSGITFKLKVV